MSVSAYQARSAAATSARGRERKPTAKGMGFVVLEDETGRVQVALPPALAETLRPALAASRILAVGGKVERAADGKDETGHGTPVTHVTLLATRIQPYTGTQVQQAERRRGHEPQRTSRQASG